MIVIQFTNETVNCTGQGITLLAALADLERRLDAVCVGGPVFFTSDLFFVEENGLQQLMSCFEYVRTDPGDDGREDYVLKVVPA